MVVDECTIRDVWDVKCVCEIFSHFNIVTFSYFHIFIFRQYLYTACPLENRHLYILFVSSSLLLREQNASSMLIRCVRMVDCFSTVIGDVEYENYETCTSVVAGEETIRRF